MPTPTPDGTSVVAPPLHSQPAHFSSLSPTPPPDPSSASSELNVLHSAASTSFVRVLVLLSCLGGACAFVFCVCIRWSCYKNGVLPAQPWMGQLYTGEYPAPRFVFMLLYNFIPRQHVFAAFVLCWAFSFRKSGREEEEDEVEAFDFTRLVEWKRFLRTVALDICAGCERVIVHFKRPTTSASPSTSTAPPSSVADQPGLSQSLLDNDALSSPVSAPLSVANAATPTATALDGVEKESLAMGALLSCLYFMGSLFVAPLCVLRWYCTPRHRRELFYRLFLWNAAFTLVERVPLLLTIAFGAPTFDLAGVIGPVMRWVGYTESGLATVINGVPRSYIISRLIPCAEFLFLVVVFRPSRIDKRERAVPPRRDQEAEQGAGGDSGLEEGDVERRYSSSAVEPIAFDVAPSDLDQDADAPADTDPTSPASTGPHDDAESPTSASYYDDEEDVAYSPRRIRATLVHWLRRMSNAEQRPSLLWVWLAVYLGIEFGHSALLWWVTIDVSEAVVSTSLEQFSQSRLVFFFATLGPMLLLEQWWHCTSTEHRLAFARRREHESGAGWAHDLHHSSLTGRPCSCHWWRVAVVAWTLSFGFLMFNNELGAAFGRVKGKPDDALLAYTWLVVKFFLFMSLWKIAVMWSASYALPAGGVVAAVFPIQLLEDTWSYIFFTSFAPFSWLFWTLCVVHFVKTLLRDLNVPYLVVNVAVRRLYRLLRPHAPRVARSSADVDVLGLPRGWQTTYDRRLLRHQNFLTFVCAKVIVLSVFAADMLPEYWAGLSSYVITTYITEIDRAFRVVALLWLIGQQVASHGLTLLILQRYEAWQNNGAARDDKQQQGDKDADLPAVELYAAPTTPTADSAAQSRQWDEAKEEVKEEPAGKDLVDESKASLHVDPDADPASPTAMPASFAEPRLSLSSPRSSATIVLALRPADAGGAGGTGSVASMLDVNWRSRVLFFSLAVLRVSVDCVTQAALNKHRYPQAWAPPWGGTPNPDVRCVTGW